MVVLPVPPVVTWPVVAPPVAVSCTEVPAQIAFGVAGLMLTVAGTAFTTALVVAEVGHPLAPFRAVTV